MHASETPQFLISVSTCIQHFATSPPPPTHRPRISRIPSQATANACSSPPPSAIDVATGPIAATIPDAAIPTSLAFATSPLLAADLSVTLTALGTSGLLGGKNVPTPLLITYP